MPRYWLDSSVFIQAYQGPYGFDIAPGFWEALARGVEEGVLRCPDMVFKELSTGDELAAWMRARRSTMVVAADERVQRTFAPIAIHVQNSYAPQWARKFLSGADPWVVAHAQSDTGIAVTQETRQRQSRAKIPIVCDQFGIESINMYELLRRLGVKLR